MADARRRATARMARAKFEVGEAVEMLCNHLRSGQVVNDWLAGIVVEADHRMAAVRLAADVYASNGWPIPDRVLWCAHGSRNIRRLAAGPQPGVE